MLPSARRNTWLLLALSWPSCTYLACNNNRLCWSCTLCAHTEHVTKQLPCLPALLLQAMLVPLASHVLPLAQGASTQLSCPSRGHADDVWDLSWSPDSTALVSASSDNECNLFSVAAMKSKFRLNQHKHLVQGVAWDPAREYILSASSDKTVRWAGVVGIVCLGMAGWAPITQCILSAGQTRLSGGWDRLHSI